MLIFSKLDIIMLINMTQTHNLFDPKEVLKEIIESNGDYFLNIEEKYNFPHSAEILFQHAESHGSFKK